MNFELIWSDAAFDRMAFIVRNHLEHKDELARAVRELSAALLADAGTVGESRGDGLRIAFFDPVVVDFSVAEADRRVVILSVRLRHPLF